MSYSSSFSPRTCFIHIITKTKKTKIMKPIIIMGKNDLPCTCTEGRINLVGRINILIYRLSRSLLGTHELNLSE